MGNKKITEEDIDLLLRVNPRLKPRANSPQGKQKILESYAEQEMLYQESARRGLDHSKSVKDKLNLYEKIIISQALLDDEVDKKVKEYYDNHRDEFERVKISHILIGTEESSSATSSKGTKAKKKTSRSEAQALKMAEDVRARLAKGEDFAIVANEVSDDEKTKGRGGELGYVTIHDARLERDGLLPLAEKAFALKIGEVSDVIKTKDGFHVIKVSEAKQLEPYEDVEPGLKFRFQNDIRQTLLEDLKKKYKVEYAKTETAPPLQQGAPVAVPANVPPSVTPPPPTAH